MLNLYVTAYTDNIENVWSGPDIMAKTQEEAEKALKTVLPPGTKCAVLGRLIESDEKKVNILEAINFMYANTPN